MESREWQLPGPAQHLLDKVDVSRYLGIKVRSLERLIGTGRFPVGQLIGGRMTWTGADVAAYLHLRGRFQRVKKVRQSASRTVESATIRDKSRQPKNDG